MVEKMQELHPGKIFKIENNSIYQIVAVGKDISSGKKAVVYQELSEPFEVLIMPWDDFCNTITKEYLPEREGDGRHFESGLKSTGDSLQLKLMEFLDAEDSEKKLSVLLEMKGTVTHRILETLAVSLDLRLDKEEDEDNFEDIKKHLMMLQKFEGKRLR